MITLRMDHLGLKFGEYIVYRSKYSSSRSPKAAKQKKKLIIVIMALRLYYCAVITRCWQCPYRNLLAIGDHAPFTKAIPYINYLIGIIIIMLSLAEVTDPLVIPYTSFNSINGIFGCIHWHSSSIVFML